MERKNSFLEEMRVKTITELQTIIEHKENYTDEELLAAICELSDRGQLVPDRSALEDTFPEENNNPVFPKKPAEPVQRKWLNKSFITLLLSMGVLYYFVKLDIQLILILIIVLLIHETGHYLVMRRYDYKDVSIFFLPFFGAYTTGSKTTLSQKQEILVLLAGPVPGIIIGTICLILALQDANDFLMDISWVFLLINLFNLLPVLPMDGGKIIKYLFFESNTFIHNVFISLGIIASIVLAVIFENFEILMFTAFAMAFLYHQLKIDRLRKRIRKEGICLNKSYDEINDEEYWRIRDMVLNKGNAAGNLTGQKRYAISKDENEVIFKVMETLQKQPVMDLGLTGKFLVISFLILTFSVPIYIFLWK